MNWGNSAPLSECIISLSISFTISELIILLFIWILQESKRNTLYELAIYQVLSLQTLPRRIKISPEQPVSSSKHGGDIKLAPLKDFQLPFKVCSLSHFLSLDFLFYPRWPKTQSQTIPKSLKTTHDCLTTITGLSNDTWTRISIVKNSLTEPA